MPRAVLDTSALLALINRERGADQVAGVLADAVLSTVNCAEVYSKLSERQMPAAAFDTILRVVATVIDFDIGLARRAGELRAATRHVGLSLGDRACLALAEREGLPAVTAERLWGELDVGVAIQLIR